jgi:uncharacterized protein YkwD
MRRRVAGFITLFSSLLVVLATYGISQAQTQTIANLQYLSALEREIINEVNLARANPTQYATYLEQLKKLYVGKDLKRPGQVALTTVEGVSAVDEAIQFLRAQKPLPPLTPYQGMCLAARDHLTDLGKTGSTGHKGSDGSVPEDRLNRYGSWTNVVGENIAYSSITARETVMGWIVDDGNPTRGHRKNLFNAQYLATGIALGGKSAYGTMCINTFAGGFADKPASAQSSKDKTKPAAKMFE